MLKYRLPSGLLMGAVILSSVFLKGDTGKYIFMVFGICLAFAAVYEYLKMLEKIKLPSYTILTSFASSVILGMAVLQVPFEFYCLFLSLLVISGWFRIIVAEDKEDAMKKNVTSASALIYLVFPLIFLAFIYTKDFFNVSGRIYFLFMLMVTKFGDTGAYTFGMTSSKILPGGNHKILPKISPKKSWEGTLGGMFTSIGVSYAFCHFVPEIVKDNGSLFPLFAGIILFWGGFTGDLVESALKRTAGVKDSGAIIPGMGGALDVVDSLVLNAPLFYLFLFYS